MRCLRTIITGVLLVSFSFSGYAQTFSISPKSLQLEDSIPVDGATTLQFDLANLTSSDLALSWELIEFDLPVGWNYNLCDYLDCLLPPLPNQRDMQLIPANLATGVYMKLWVAPLDIPGDGVLRFHVYETGNTSTGDTITFRVNASGFTGILEDSADQIRVVPNPVSDQFYIKGLPNSNQRDVYIYMIDITGRSTRLMVGADGRYRTGELASGIYNLLINDGTELISKRVVIQ